ncbi:MAG: hypothetical protein H7210_14690, partial [Pyrinomonadaceae bacterium]|nr:hypothetical protein [Phycisphaerales bacterium]
MKLMTLSSVVLSTVLATAGPASAQPKGDSRPYEGHKVVRVNIRDQRDLRTMLALSPDIWSESAGIGPVDFRIPPEALDAMKVAGIEYVTLIENVQAAVDVERDRLSKHHAQPQRGQAWFTDFKNLPQIEEHMGTLQAMAPGRVQLLDIGRTIENRPTRAMTVVGAGGTRTRPA